MLLASSFFSRKEKEKGKIVGVPRALYSALSLANKCIVKYGGMNKFKEECESRIFKAKAKFENSQSSTKPHQKKRSKIESSTSFFTGNLKELSSFFGTTLHCGLLVSSDLTNSPSPSSEKYCYTVTPPYQQKVDGYNKKAFSGDFEGVHLSIELDKDMKNVKMIEENDFRKVYFGSGASADVNKELGDLFASASCVTTSEVEDDRGDMGTRVNQLRFTLPPHVGEAEV